jgi:hypothetical protein
LTCLVKEKLVVISHQRAPEGIFMRQTICGAALLFASLGVACASAEDIAKWHDHSTAGGGGWTMGSGVGGWKQNSTVKASNSASSEVVSSSIPAEAFTSTKAFTSAAAGGVSSSTTNEAASNAAAGAVSSNTTNLVGQRPTPLRVLVNDSDCVYVTQQTPSGKIWRPGCK